MRGFETYNHLLELTGPAAIAQLFYAGMFLVVAAMVLLSLGRMRWLGRTLGILGVLAFMLALFLIHEQQAVEVKDDHVTVTHWRYSPAVRFQVRIALLGLPAADPVLYRSARNIDGVQVAPVAEFNTYDVLKQRYLILTREALAALKERVKTQPARRAVEA